MCLYRVYKQLWTDGRRKTHGEWSQYVTRWAINFGKKRQTHILFNFIQLLTYEYIYSSIHLVLFFQSMIVNFICMVMNEFYHRPKRMLITFVYRVIFGVKKIDWLLARHAFIIKVHSWRKVFFKVHTCIHNYTRVHSCSVWYDIDQFRKYNICTYPQYYDGVLFCRYSIKKCTKSVF